MSQQKIPPDARNSPRAATKPRCRRITKSVKDKQTNKKTAGTFLVVQWLRLRAPTADGTSSIPGQGTKIPRAQLRGHQKTNEKVQSRLCPSHCSTAFSGSPSALNINPHSAPRPQGPAAPGLPLRGSFSRSGDRQGGLGGCPKGNVGEAGAGRAREGGSGGPVLSPGEVHGQRTLAGCCLQGCRELDTTHTHTHTHTHTQSLKRQA